ncbi:MAG: hypothetical protein IPJ15_06810 [Actinomycetales bacterium]|nr:hypothetical protein [Candidatus Phosphoribacter baldrii]
MTTIEMLDVAISLWALILLSIHVPAAKARRGQAGDAVRRRRGSRSVPRRHDRRGMP